jgi:hypothetical protein
LTGSGDTREDGESERERVGGDCPTRAEDDEDDEDEDDDDFGARALLVGGGVGEEAGANPEAPAVSVGAVDGDSPAALRGVVVTPAARSAVA